MRRGIEAKGAALAVQPAAIAEETASRIMESAESQGGHASAEAFVSFAARVRARVDERLESWLDERAAEERRHGPKVHASLQALRAFALRGGKRWRAALLAAAYQGLGGEGGADQVIMAGVSIELLQTYLLVHDDWMDGDAQRRGGPSLHTALSAELGSSRLGAIAAVLAGDHAAALAHEALFAVPISGARLAEAARELARAEREVTLGQFRDLFGDASVALETTYALKTGSYSVRGPLCIGAALAGASPAQRAELERFASPLGIAFQLRDDLLGTFGDPRETGKPAASDLREGKRTPLLEALEQDPEGRALLGRVVGVAEAAPEDIEALRRRLTDSGARARVEARLGELVEQAQSALAEVTLERAMRDVLAGAVRALAYRER